MSNSITAAGRLTADSEIRYTNSGEPVLGFTVASDVGFGDKKVTNFFRCTIWGKRGESLVQHLKKGQQVTIFGLLSLREFESNGVKRLSPDVRVNEIALQGGKQSGQQDSQPRYEKPAPVMDDLDGDVPF